MGLINSLLICLIHLAFVVFDIVFLLMLLKVVNDRWRPSWLSQTMKTIEPIIILVLDSFQRLIGKMTGKSCPEKTRIVLLIVCLWIIRSVIISFVK